MRTRWISLAMVVVAQGHARAQDLAIDFRNAANLAAAAVDQFGQPFTVAGLSGIAHAGNDTYWAVLDNSDHLVRLRIVLNADGSIASAAITGGLRLSQARDHEDLVLTSWNTTLLCEENGPAIHEYSLSHGDLLRSFAVPPIFATRRPNFGFEGLTLHGTSLYVANEEALTVDGGVSTPSTGTRVRLQCFDLTPSAATAGTQAGYLTAPMHAGAISSGRSGLVALVMLPSGRLLTMERSLANNFLRFFETRIYEATLSGATETSALPSLLDAPSLATKRLLYTGGQTNLEGLCLGPALAGGGHALIGVVDDGDPISVNRVVSFVVTGPVGVPCEADFNADGFLDFFDYDSFVGCYEGAACPPGHSQADFNRDGFVDFFDYDAFVTAYETGC